jgi:hypothetical protein
MLRTVEPGFLSTAGWNVPALLLRALEPDAEDASVGPDLANHHSLPRDSDQTTPPDLNALHYMTAHWPHDAASTVSNETASGNSEMSAAKPACPDFFPWQKA